MNKENKIDNSVKLISIGGYGEFGNNCSIITYKNNFIILDVGSGFASDLHHKKTTSFADEYHAKKLIDSGYKLLGIFISHAHLDHVGGLSDFLKDEEVNIFCTRFVAEFHKDNLKYNRLIVNVVEFEKEVTIGDFNIKYYPIQHSTPQSSLIKVKVKDKNIGYLSDWKMDFSPTLGKKSDFKYIAKKEKFTHLITDVTSINKPITESESVAVSKVSSLLEMASYYHDLLIVSTFCSHIARLKIILEKARELGRNVYCNKSTYNAIKIGASLGYIQNSYFEDCRLLEHHYDTIMENRSASLILGSGHQYQRGSTFLSLIERESSYVFTKKECFIQAASLIQKDLYPACRTKFQDFITKYKIPYYEGVHVGGHAGYIDHYYCLKDLKPKIVIPNHASLGNFAIFANLAKEQHYKLNKTLFLLLNDQSLTL